MNNEHCESTREKKEFFGREDKLKEIEQALECQKGAVVLHGLPGMGQTALAREYARRYNRGDVVFVSIARQWQRQLPGLWRTLSETISAKETKKRLLRSMRIL